MEQQPEYPRGCSRHVGLTQFVAAGREPNQVQEDFIKCFDVDLVCGTSDEDAIEVDTHMRETLEEAVHCPLKSGWSRRNSEG